MADKGIVTGLVLRQDPNNRSEGITTSSSPAPCPLDRGWERSVDALDSEQEETADGEKVTVGCVELGDDIAPAPEA